MADTSHVIKEFEGFEIKDAEKGEVQAIIATLGVIDKDGDIITPDAIKDGAKVAMSAYGHSILTRGEQPVGKGKVFIDGDKAVFRGRVFLATEKGRETFEVLKEMGPDQQWSWGFRVLGAEVPSEEQRKRGAYRVITKTDTFEVSPVAIGAGVSTRTLGVKEADDLPDPAIEAARLKAEEDAAAARAEKERQDLAAKQLAEINEASDRMFKRMPATVAR